VRAAEALAAVEPGGPLSDQDLVTLFAPLAEARRIALAVSGGADSLALLDAIDRWQRRKGGPEVVVLTVDHRLRPGSGEAAVRVRDVAVGRGLAAQVLIREGDAPEADIEAEARRARYRLLFDACCRLGATHLVTAHHRDDIAETFLMRLKRGAGIFGLAAMRPAVDVGGVMLVRPFLSVSRARLAATTAAAGWMPIDDPMNADPRFARTAARRLLAEGGLDAKVVAAVASRIADLADVVDAAATKFIAEAVTSDEYAIAWLDVRRFADAEDEVRARVLVRLLIAVGGDDYPPRSERLSGLLSAMSSEAGVGRFKRTLSGVVVERRGGRFAVYREAGRAGPPSAARGGQPPRGRRHDRETCRSGVAGGGHGGAACPSPRLGNPSGTCVSDRSDALPGGVRLAPDEAAFQTATFPRFLAGMSLFTVRGSLPAAAFLSC
jgi:tRNA(Ile)-lysidine synthase